MRGRARPRRWTLRVAWTIAGVDAALALATAAAVLAGVVRLPADLSQSYPNLVFAVTLPSLGAVVLRRAPGNRLGPLYLVSGTATAVAVGSYAYAQYGLVTAPGALPAAVAVGWISAWVWALGTMPLVTLGALWYPDGRLPGQRWRLVEATSVLAVAGLVLAAMIEPGRMANHPVRDNPLGVASAESAVSVLGAASFALVLASLAAAVASLGVRYRRGDALRRAQLRWLLVAVGLLAFAASAPSRGVTAAAATVLMLLAVPLVPAALALAILRHEVFGRVIVRRSLTYVVLSVLLLAVYVGLVAAVHALFGHRADSGAALVGAGLVAALSAPLRDRVQSAVDRTLFGQRGDPYAAMRSLGQRLEEAGSPERMLRNAVVTVADALRVPYVAIELRDGDDPAAAVGDRSGPEHRVVLQLGGERVGGLVVGQRTEKDPFSPADLALLVDLARHMGVAAQSVLLTRELQRSRERLVATGEEERRRVSRDLHDGLGPALAGIAFGLDAVRNRLPTGAGETDAALQALKAEVHDCVADVRRLVNGLRPPALDQLGLITALQQSAARLCGRNGLVVCVETAPASFPALPAAVEMASYRIVTEALNNTLRHAGAHRAVVRLRLHNESLELEVVDDGKGLTAARRDGQVSGVGLAAMAERAEELGGTCEVYAPPAGGTAVRAVIPMTGHGA